MVGVDLVIVVRCFDYVVGIDAVSRLDLLLAWLWRFKVVCFGLVAGC